MTEVEVLRTKIKMLENEMAMDKAVLESIEDIFAGKEPNDFMLSFSLVREVFEMKWRLEGLEK